MFYIPATAKVKVDATKTVRLCKDSINKVAIFSTLYNLWCLFIELSRLSALSCIELFQGNNHQKGESIKMIFSSLLFVFLMLISLPFCILLPFKFFYHNVLLRMTQKISESCKISEEHLANTTGIPLIEAVEKIQEGEDITEDEQSLADYLKTMVSELAEAASKTLAANFKQTVLELAKNPELSKAISTPILEATQDLMNKLEGIIERAREGLKGDIGEIGNAFIERTADKVKEISKDLMKKLDEDIRAALNAESNKDDDEKKTPSIIDNLFKLWQKNVNTSLDALKKTVLELAKKPELSKAISTPILEATQDLMNKLEGIIERAREGLKGDIGEIGNAFIERTADKVKEISKDLMKKLDEDIRAALNAESNKDDDEKKTPSIIDNLFKLWQKNVNTSLDALKKTVLELAKKPELSKAISTPILEATQDLMNKLEGIIERAREGLMIDGVELVHAVVERVGKIAEDTTGNIKNTVTGFNQGLDGTVDRALGRLNGITITPNNPGRAVRTLGLGDGVTVNVPNKQTGDQATQTDAAQALAR